MDFRPVASVPVSASLQQRFQWQWSPTAVDAGTNTFAAFVRSTLPVLDLEINPDSRLEVKVSCFSGAGSSRNAEFRGFLVSWGVGDGAVEPGQTTLSGHFDDPAITSTWRFDRP